jgi:formamidopyrimidine-DNA glycosylase
MGVVPELPEVQAHAERLTGRLGGSVLRSAEPIAFSALKTYAPPPDAAVGCKLEAVTRRGKLLVLGFGATSHVVHLMQGGRLKPDPGTSKRPRGGQFRWRFDGGSGPETLLLTEAGTERKAGVWVVEGDPLTQPPLADLGPEADRVEPAELAERFAAHSQRLHGFLRDQRMLAGIGRRLANEICHRARLSPFAATGKLTAEDAERVVEAIRGAIAEGLEYERGRPDMSVSKERPGAVHHRAGELCPVCGDVIRAVEYRDYSVAYCPTCQTGGKILADNVYSKLGVERSAQPARGRRRG